MAVGSSYYEDYLPPGPRSKRSASDEPEKAHPHRIKTVRQNYDALPAPGLPPTSSTSTGAVQGPTPPKTEPRFLETFPLEVRNQIYKNIAASTMSDDRTFIIETKLICAVPSFSTFSRIATTLASPLVLVGKQFITEYVKELFLSGSLLLIGGPCRIHEWLYGQQHEMCKLHNIEFQWEGMPENLLQRLPDVTKNEIRPLLDFLRQETQVRSITIPLYFMEREGTSYSSRRGVHSYHETRLARSHRRQVPCFWTSFIYHALKNLLAPGSGFEEIIIRYHPYDMWACFDPEVKAKNLLGKVPCHWDTRASPDLCGLRDMVDDDESMVGLDEMFYDISVRERGEAEEGEEALIRFKKP